MDLQTSNAVKLQDFLDWDREIHIEIEIKIEINRDRVHIYGHIYIYKHTFLHIIYIYTYTHKLIYKCKVKQDSDNILIFKSYSDGQITHRDSLLLQFMQKYQLKKYQCSLTIMLSKGCKINITKTISN